METNNDNSIEPEEWFRLAVFRFIDSLRPILGSKDEKLACMGSLSASCAWEVRDETIGSGDVLTKSHNERFTSDELAAIQNLLDRVSQIPGSVFEEGGEGLSDPVWEDVRKVSIVSLSHLEPNTIGYYLALRGDSDWLDEYVCFSD